MDPAGAGPPAGGAADRADDRFGDPERPDDSRLRALGIDPWADDQTPPGDDRVRPVDTTSSTSAEPAGRSGAEVEVAAATPLWLSHHWPADYDRCVVISGLHVCRRCLVLYPLALVTGIAVSIGSWWDHSSDPWVLWLFPLPGVIEFVLDNLRVISYRPRRQVVLSAGGAVAAGIGYVRYLDDSTDALAWTVLAVYVAATLSAAIVGGLWRRRPASSAPRGGHA